jgi:hypothetical protein
VTTPSPSRSRLTAKGLLAWSEFARDAMRSAPHDLGIVLDLVAARAATDGERPAVIDDDGVTSYEELGRAVDREVTRLRRAGIGAGDRVIVGDVADTAACVALLGALRIGAWPGPTDGPYDDSRPPGVDLAILVAGMREACDLATDDVIALATPLSADGDVAVSLRRLLPAWAAGAAVAIRRGGPEYDPLDVLGWARDIGVTQLDIDKGWWRGAAVRLERQRRRVDLSGLRRVVLGDPAPPGPLVDLWRSHAVGPARVLAVFQPAGSAQAAVGEVKEGASTTLRPLPRSTFAVVDQSGRLCSPFVTGSVITGGPATDLDPDVPPDRPGRRWSRTGTVGRLVRAGGSGWEIDVRSSGEHPHPDPYEAVRFDEALWTVEDLLDGVLVVSPGGDRTALVAVSRRPSDDAERMQRRLMTHLPLADVPDPVVLVPEFPRQRNGDLDPAAVVQLLRREPPVTAGPDAVDRLESVRQVWQEVLGVERVVDGDDFFRLGGTSLTALRLTTELRRRGSVALRTADLYVRPRFVAFATWLATQAETATPHSAGIASLALGTPAVKLDRGGLVAWLADRRDRGDGRDRALVVPHTGHADRSIGLVEGFHHLCADLAPLSSTTHGAAVLRQLVERHPLLRSRVRFTSGSWHHVITDDLPDLAVVESPEDESALVRSVSEHLQHRFDPTSQPPVRAAAIRDAGGLHLHVWISHTVCDGEAVALLRRQLAELTGGDRLPVSLPSTVNELESYARRLEALRTPGSDADERLRVEAFQTARTEFAARVSGLPTGASRTWRRLMTGDPVRALAQALTAIARAWTAPRLPILCDFHGRLDPSAFSLVGNYAAYLPIVLEPVDPGTAGDQLATMVGELRDRYPSWRVTDLGELAGCVRVSLFQSDDGSGPDAGMSREEDLVSDGIEVTALVHPDCTELLMSSRWQLDTVMTFVDAVR